MDIVGGGQLKKIISLFIIILTLTFGFSYEKVVNWDNNEFKTDLLRFDGDAFTLGKDQKVDFANVSYISFNLKEEQEIKSDAELDDVDPKELLKRAEEFEKKYPDASLLVLYDDGIEKLNKDGTRTTRSRYSVKIMNEKELNYSNISLYFIKEKYESRIISARSISPEGKMLELDKKKVSYTSPSQGLAFFSGRKDEYIVRAQIPGVSVGSIVDFEWEVVEASPEDENQFYTKWFFGSDSPVYESRVQYIVPIEKEFYWVTKNFEPFKSEPEITESDGYRIYFFKRGECPPYIKEPYSPPLGEMVPFVFGSVFQDQTYLSKWLSKFLKERMFTNDLMELVIYEVLEKTKAETEEEKVAAIYRFVQDYVHYRSIKTSLSSGLTGHPAPQTFENKYGDCIDKSILFSSLLKLVDIEAYPVIVNTNENPRPLYGEIGVVTGNHAITEIHLKENGKNIIYLDSTSSTYRYPSFRSDDQSIPAWNPILNTVREVEPLDPKWNTQIYFKNIKLLENGNAEISTKAIYAGDWEAGIRAYLLSVKNEEIKSLLGSIVANDYPGSILKDYEFTSPGDYMEPLSLALKYEANDLLKKTGDFYIMDMPISYELDYLTLEERKNPMKFPATEGKKNTITITIPKGFKIKGLPTGLKIENDHIKYEAHYSLEENTIKFIDHFERSGCKIMPDDYIIYKSDLLKIDHFIRNPLIFVKE